MSEATSLRLTQQRVFRKFLRLHFSSRTVESEKKLFASNEGYVNYVRDEFEAEDGKAVTVWHPYLPTSLKFFMKKLDNSSLKEVQNLETFLEGDHRKVQCILMAIVLIMHANELKEPHRIELKLGEINE